MSTCFARSLWCMWLNLTLLLGQAQLHVTKMMWYLLVFQSLASAQLSFREEYWNTSEASQVHLTDHQHLDIRLPWGQKPVGLWCLNYLVCCPCNGHDQVVHTVFSMQEGLPVSPLYPTGCPPWKRYHLAVKSGVRYLSARWHTTWKMYASIATQHGNGSASFFSSGMTSLQHASAKVFQGSQPAYSPHYKGPQSMVEPGGQTHLEYGCWWDAWLSWSRGTVHLGRE